MKRVLVGLVAAAPFWIWAQSVQIAVDRADQLYQCGESATFTVKVLNKEQQLVRDGTLRVRLTNFGPQEVAVKSFDLAQENPATIVGSLREPGFLKCVADAKLDKSYSAQAGAAFEPQKIVAGSERPADFDAFWDAAIKRLAAEVPLDARIEKIDKFCNEKHEGYRVSFATFDNLRVYGFLSVPVGTGPFPVVVTVPGAGPGVVAPNLGLADRGYIHLFMNVHPFEPADSVEGQKKLYGQQDARVKAEFGVPRYCIAGAATREGYFYYRIMLGINRAVDWVAARPDVDKMRILYTGSSQGGGFGFYLLGLNQNFAKGVIHVPAITDLLGFQKGRDSGWPKLIENMRESDKAAATLNAPYFDGAHFAPRIKCPVRVSVGFIDNTCPPAAVYAGYNALTVQDRDIVHGLKMPHAVFAEVRQPMEEWLLK